LRFNAEGAAKEDRRLRMEGGKAPFYTPRPCRDMDCGGNPDNLTSVKFLKKPIKAGLCSK
jgi:hypothetical protein